VLAVEAAPLPKLVDPLVVEIGLAGRRSHDRAGAMDEQTGQVLVPALRDAHQHLAIAAGELSRDETNPGGEGKWLAQVLRGWLARAGARAWRAAVQIASASLPSFFCLRTNGFTYCGLMIFT
jgi:hypothetical protein